MPKETDKTMNMAKVQNLMQQGHQTLTHGMLAQSIIRLGQLKDMLKGLFLEVARLKTLEQSLAVAMGRAPSPDRDITPDR